MKHLVVLLSLIPLTFAACSPDLEFGSVTHTESPIMNGTLDLAHDAVGIVYGGNMGLCTGTLIAPNKVLTAAHCVLTQKKPYKVIYPIYFYKGDMLGPKFKATSVATHPSYDGGNKADLAVFMLDKNVPAAPPYSMASTPPKKGEKITIVGYGLADNGAGADGWKRRGENEISAVYPAIFTFSGGAGKALTCHGDSGGPAFAWRNNKEILVGVCSTGLSGCDTLSMNMRVDAYLSWINTLKVTKKVYGGECLTSKDCTSEICMPAAGKWICTQQCDSKSCPNEDKCLVYSGSEASKVCLPGSATSLKGVGADCTKDADCKSNICAKISDHQQICTQICDTLKQNCPATFKCMASVLGGLCVPGGPPGKQLGEVCDDDYDCASNTCAKLSGTAVCASWCDKSSPNACPTGFICQGIAGKTQGLCLKGTVKPPTKKAFGTDCAKHDECESGLCGADADGRTFCTATCDPAQGCTASAGYDCVPAGDGTHVCAPLAGDDDSGCALAGTQSPRWPLLLLTLPLLLLWWRRGR
jgi:V8-like Glu-specific endopeptidase